MSDNMYKSTSKPFNGWMWVAVLFMVISAVMGAIALKNSQPLQCNDVVRLNDGRLVCQVELESEDSL